MNEYRNRSSGKIVSDAELRDAFPNVSLPAVLDPITLDARGFDAVLAFPAPMVGVTQVAVRNGAQMDEKGNWIYAWRLEELPAAVVAANAAAAEQAARDRAKQQRADAVAAIKVDVDGMTFDGDETSQGRIARAILAMEAAGTTSTPWTLSNNTTVAVTSTQLRQVLVKAGLAQTALWPL